jgi:hypothetical protein
MALEYIDNHVELADARIAEQYKANTHLVGIIDANAEQWQEADDALWQLATERYLYSDAEIGSVTVNYEAVGEQLDVLGRILGLTRQNLTDDQYRLMLKAQVKLLRCSGTGEELIAVFHAARPDATVTVSTEPPAYVYVTLDGDVIETAALANVLVKMMYRGHAAGVAGTLCWQETADSGCLILSDATAYPETSATQGLGDATDSSTGGALSGAAGVPT